MPSYPDFESVLDGFRNSQVLEARQSYRANCGIIFFFFVSVIALYVLNYFFSELTIIEQYPSLRYLSPRWLAILPICLLIELVRRRHDDLYMIGPSSITHYNGRLSMSYNVPSVKYADIKSLTVRQDIFGRILGYGDIDVETAASSETEITVSGVLDPKSLARIIERLKDYNVRATMNIVRARAAND